MLKPTIKIRAIKLVHIISANKFLFIGISIIFLLLSTFVGFNLYFKNRIYPGVKVLNLYLGGKKLSEVSTYLSQNIPVPDKLELSSNEKTFITVKQNNYHPKMLSLFLLKSSFLL